MWELIATVCSGLFAGAAIYVTLVEHPARLQCGIAAAVAEFGPSYRRGAVMQASLSAIGTLAGVGGWWQGHGTHRLVAALLLGSLTPFTLLVIMPTNKRLLDPALDPASREAADLLRQWGQLHLVRTVAGAAAFLILLARIVA
jgi:uncharacterized membrane protein